MSKKNKAKENRPDDISTSKTQLKEDMNENEDSSVHADTKDEKAVPSSKSESQCPTEGEDKTVIGEPETLTAEELAELRQKAEERDEIFEKLQRATADYLNFKKRKDKEFDNFKQFALQDFMEALLPLLDDLSRAIKSADKDAQNFESLLTGIQLIENQLKKIMSDFGVEPIEAVGKSFDPALHEVVMQEENEEHPNHTVIEEFQRGYLLNGRLLRPSKVKVSIEPTLNNSEDNDAETESDGKTEDGFGIAKEHE